LSLAKPELKQHYLNPFGPVEIRHKHALG
jgi:hypothetical protein